MNLLWRLNPERKKSAMSLPAANFRAVNCLEWLMSRKHPRNIPREWHHARLSNFHIQSIKVPCDKTDWFTYVEVKKLKTMITSHIWHAWADFESIFHVAPLNWLIARRKIKTMHRPDDRKKSGKAVGFGLTDGEEIDDHKSVHSCPPSVSGRFKVRDPSWAVKKHDPSRSNSATSLLHWAIQHSARSSKSRSKALNKICNVNLPVRDFLSMYGENRVNRAMRSFSRCGSNCGGFVADASEPSLELSIVDDKIREKAKPKATKSILKDIVKSVQCHELRSSAQSSDNQFRAKKKAAKITRLAAKMFVWGERRRKQKPLENHLRFSSGIKAILV